MPFGLDEAEDVVAGRQRRDVLEAGRGHAQTDGQLPGCLEPGGSACGLGAGLAGGQTDRDGDRCEHGDELLHVRPPEQRTGTRGNLAHRGGRTHVGVRRPAAPLRRRPRRQLAGRHSLRATSARRPARVPSSSSGVASRAAPCTRSRAASMAERKLGPSLKGRLGNGRLGGGAGGRSSEGGGGGASVEPPRRSGEAAARPRRCPRRASWARRPRGRSRAGCRRPRTPSPARAV